MAAREPSFTLGSEAIRELQDMARWYQGWRRNESPGAAEPFTKFGPRTVRWAKCMANTICTSYPSAPANTFPIRMGELDFDDAACGYNVETFTPYTPVMDRVAFDHHNTYHHSGEIVLVFMAHGKWYVMSSEQLLARTFLAADMCPTDEDDEQLVDVTGSTYLPTCETFSPSKVVNPYHHRGPDGAKALILKEHCQGADEQWLVIDVEKTRYCAVIGIEDRPTCLVSAGLQLAGEWCPSDEPILACKVVEYTDCTTTLGICDDSWTFEPLFACCGQDVGATSASQSQGSSGDNQRGPGPLPGQFLP